MGGIDNILKKIKDDAANICMDILTKANENAKQITDDAEKKATEEAASVQKKYAAAVEAEYNRVISAGHSDARKLLLQKKQELIDRAFAEALSSLEAMDDFRASTILCRMAEKEVPGAEEILLPAKLRSQTSVIEQNLRAIGFSGRLVFSEDISGGLIIRKGGVEWNKTFDALIRQYREDLEPSVVSILF